MKNVPQDLKVLGSLSGWIDAQRMVLGIDWILGGLFALVLFLGILVWFIYRSQKSPIERALYSKTWTLFFWAGLSGVLWFVMRYQFVRVLGSRVVLGLIILVSAVFLVKLVQYKIKILPKLRMDLAAQEQKLKYLKR